MPDTDEDQRPPTAKDLVAELIANFGDPDVMTALLAADVEWWLTPTVEVFPHHMIGRAMVAETMRFVFGEVYANVRVTVHSLLGDGEMAAIRFTLNALALGTIDYENEYAIFVHARDGLITRVWEYLDMQLAMNQLASEPAGD